MLPVLVAMMALQGPELPKTPVMSHLAAMTVSQALGLISKSAKVALKADDSLNDDVVLIRAAPSTVQDIGHHLAVCLDAEWKADGTGFVLTRSEAAIQKEESDQLAYDAKGFELAQQKLKDADQKLPEWDPLAAKNLVKQLLDAQSKNPPDPMLDQSLAVQVPAMRLLNRMVASVPPEELAKIAPWNRIVYTVRPNRAQRPMTEGGAGAMIAFLNDQAIWEDAAEPFAKLNLSPALASARPYRADPKRVFLALGREGDSTIHAQLRVVDSSGGNLAVLNTDIAPITQSAGIPQMSNPDFKVLLSPTLAGVQGAIVSGKGLRDLGGLEALLRPQLEHPETFDPLSLLPGTLIDQATTGMAPNLVAVIPDEALSLYRNLAAQPLTSGTVCKALSDLGLQAVKDGDWVQVRPARMAAEHEERLDRTLLGSILRSAPDGPAHVDLLSTLAVTPGGRSKTAFLQDVASLWSANLSDQLSKLDWTALRMFGALEEKDRKTVTSNGTVNILELNVQAQKIAREMIDRGLYGTPPSNKPGAKYLAVTSLEPTEMLASGITADATLAGTFSATPIASVPPAYPRLPSDDDKRVPIGDVLTTLKSGSSVIFGMSYLLDFKIHLYPSLYAGGILPENRYMGIAKTIEDLPAPYLDAIAKYQKG